MLKFLVDESTGLRAARALREEGWDAESVIEVMRGAEDEDILKRAWKEGRIVIANDKDFGELIYRQKLPHKGVILLRLRKDTVRHRIRVLKEVISHYEENLKNKFVTVTEGNVRIR